MKNKVVLLFSLLIVLSCFSYVSAQFNHSGADAKAPFVVNPNPHIINPPQDTPIEEIFGLNQNMFGPAGQRGRGNIFLCTTPRKLIEHRMYLNPAANTNFWFVVYEGASFNGTYNLVNSVNLPGSGPGEGWYSSGAINYDLQSGMYYMIYALFDLNANYWNQQNISPYPIPCSFGELEAGVGWFWSPIYASPPNPTETPTETLGELVAYYQTIVTDDLVPVELMSFTFQVNDNDITLNWVTATETNNQGFEVQRKTGEEFSTIAFINGYGTTTETHNYSYTDQNLDPGKYTYRLKQVDLNGSYYYYDPLNIEVLPPDAFALNQNYPNPFNPSTKISFSLAVDSKVNLTVYNLLGETVSTLVNSVMPAGKHDVNFQGENLNSGIYFYRMDAVGVDGTDYSQVRKMMLTK